MKLEVLIVPVSDAERAKEFYARLGWRLDADLAGEVFRLIQFTPPGSGCSIQFGTNLTSAAHGEHEKRIGAADPDWPGWYAAYMVAEQAGTELPQ
jgi:catechol 2,3-dioxygenase-like lactoylglutathione lyase family enzyme